MAKNWIVLGVAVVLVVVWLRKDSFDKVTDDLADVYTELVEMAEDLGNGAIDEPEALDTIDALVVRFDDIVARFDALGTPSKEEVINFLKVMITSAEPLGPAAKKAAEAGHVADEINRRMQQFDLKSSRSRSRS